MNTITYIEKANKKHNGKYGYTKTIYTGSKDKLIITCPIHGDFTQVANQHLFGTGCPKCGKKKFTTKTFIEEAINVYGDLYGYDDEVEYKTLKSKVIIKCYEHGKWEVTPQVHLMGKGCPKCAMMDTQKFINRAEVVHNKKYSYLTTNYTKAREKLEIGCPIHGIFTQRASAHLEGQGCPKCGNSFNIHLREDWLKRYEDESTSFYILRCFNAEEEFYKCGITGNMQLRYNSKSKMPYHYEIIKMITSYDNGYIFDLEKQMLSLNNKYKYTPKINFGGKGECFTKVDLTPFEK